jgi:hypothetical protein
MIFQELAKVMQRFAAKVDPAKVVPAFVEGVATAMPPLPKKQTPPDPPRRPGAYSVGPEGPDDVASVHATATQGLRPDPSEPTEP